LWPLVGVAAACFSVGVWEGRREDRTTDDRLWEDQFISRKFIAPRPSEIGSGEDHDSRERWERMMLQDPATGRVPDGIRERELSFARTLPRRIPSLLKRADETSITWQHRGPVNVGGRTRALALDRMNPAIILAGGVSGGMMRSTNGGNSWTRVGSINDLQSVSCLVQDPRPGRSSNWYYGTGELRGNSAAGGGGALYRGDGIYRSTDNGLTWTVLPSTRTGNVLFDQAFDYVWNLAVDPSDTINTVIVAATIGGIRTSTDGGASWSMRLGGNDIPNGPRYTDVVVTSTGVFYATASSRNSNGTLSTPDAGVWRSTDGLTWTNIAPAAFPSDFNRVVAAIAPTNESVVYFVGEAPAVIPTGHGVWKYTYLGGDGTGPNGSWEDRSLNLPNESGLTGNAVFGTQQSYDLVAAVSPTDPNVLFVGAINLYRANDAFATAGNWVRIGGYASASTYVRYTENHPDHHALAFHPTLPSVLYNGNDGGVFRTDNAMASSVGWTSLNNGFVTTQFYAIGMDAFSSGSPVLMGGMQDNGTWYVDDIGSGQPWLEVAGGDGGFCALTTEPEPNGLVAYVSLQNGVIYRLTQQTNGRIDPTGGTGYLFINPFVLDPTQPKRMYLAAGTTVWRNSDLTTIPLGSSNTTSVNWKNLTQTSTGGATVTALAASTMPANILYYGTSGARIFKVSNAHQDNATVTDISAGKGLPAAGYVSSIAVDPLSADRVLVAFSNYAIPSIFLTTNGGGSWQDVSGNLEERRDGTGNGPSVRWVEMLPDSGGYYYFAGTSTGLYLTRRLADTSTVWSQEAPGIIGSHVVTMVQARRSDGLVAVGTHGGGTYSATIAAVPPVPPPVDVTPRSYLVSRNYPNPFNAGTSFTISVPSAGRVRVRIVDMAGRTVATVFEETVAAGTHRVSWDGRAMDGRPVASGIYFSVLEGGGTVAAGKLTLIR
jgi:photosystem II stability/assembly factor-like uncharacterized protein